MVLEAYSVLTRLPGGLAVSAADASYALARRFPHAPLRLPDAQLAALPQTLSAAGVIGGATYDGLVALEAHANDQELLTLDRRAQGVYTRLAVSFTALR